MKNKIWLIGAGPMALDYVKVVKDLDVEYLVIGRGEESASVFYNEAGIRPITGGLDAFLQKNPVSCTHAIVAVGVELLAKTTIDLLNYGIENILVEKPAGLNREEIEKVARLTAEKGANVFVAYNRRFYASVIRAKEIIEEDGGVTSFNFEFTEWAHTIEPLKKAPGVKENWFLANSSHVVDLAFYLGGKPREISCYTAGGLSWHPSSSIFAGAGVSENGALLSYQANWRAPGRWGIEILTKRHRLILRPLEKLHVQEIGSITEVLVNIDDQKDIEHKPGLFHQTKSFIDHNYDLLIDI
ncbi:MAG: myo-inositol 2-dehydrogenase, partial [Ignavibacteriales bacterium CG12_big_fil_rev_8_21_14_0_65_30_8]